MSKDFPHPFKEVLAQQIRQFKRLPLRMSQWAVLEIKENFARGGYYDESGRFIRWKKRSSNTWGKKTDEGRALLIKTGRLKRSPKPAPLYNMARVTTDVPYAEEHQNGFKGTVTQKVKSHTRKTKGKKSSTVKGHTRKVKRNTPARPFMEVGKQAIEKWGQKVLTEIDQIFVNTPDK